MKKLLTVLSVLILAKATFANISIFPYSLDFNANSKKRIQSVRVINSTAAEKTYRVSFVDYLQHEDGSLTEIKPEETKGHSAQSYLYFSPRQFTLAPNQVQTVNVIRHPSPDMPDGEFVSHLKVAEVDTPAPAPAEEPEAKTLSIKIRALYAVTIPVTLTKGKLPSKTEIASVTHHKYDDGKLALDIVLKRAGTKSSKGSLTVLEKNKVIGEMTRVNIYPPAVMRNVTVRLDKTQEELKGATLKVVFKDKDNKKNVAEQEISL